MKILRLATSCIVAAAPLLPVTLGCGGGSTTADDGGGSPETGHMGDATKPGNDAGTRDAAHSDASNGSDTGSSQDTGTSKETGVVDANMGDTFDPLCGNGTIDPGEQCDDGNHLDLDGCSSSCQYEMVTRMTSISISGSAGPSFCVHSTNALGAKAITSTALGQLNPPLLKDVTDGTVNVLTQFFALSDLTGVTGTGLEIGVVDGKPDPAKGTWPTTGNPLDWWFLADPTAVSKGLPIGLLGSGALAAGVLTAGPSTVNVDLTLGGSLAALTMRDAKIVAMIDATPAPDVPAPPPTKLATGLVVFQTLTATGAGQGLCGDITVQSLAQIPVPMALTTGTTNCSEGYTYCGTGMPVSASCNSLLDVIVGGCKVVGGLITAVKATQPDVPPTGGTSVATLKVGSSKKVTIPTGDEDEAYSAYLQFAANRAHFTGESCTTASQCQSGQACTASVCK